MQLVRTVSALVFILSVWRISGADTTSGLQLRATQVQPGKLRISWDPQAPAVGNADRGDLQIQDGANQNVLDLTAFQLRLGSVLYQRKTGEVAIRFRVWRKAEAPVTEYVRYLNGPALRRSSPPAKPKARTTATTELDAARPPC